MEYQVLEKALQRNEDILDKYQEIPEEVKKQALELVDRVEHLLPKLDDIDEDDIRKAAYLNLITKLNNDYELFKSILNLEDEEDLDNQKQL